MAYRMEINEIIYSLTHDAHHHAAGASRRRRTRAHGRERILAEIRKVIVGQDDVIEQVLMALFTGGTA
jgi:hypothetical protein